jgi:hypothetical protein
MALTWQAAAVNTVGHSDEHAAHDPRYGSRAAILRCGLAQGPRTDLGRILLSMPRVLSVPPPIGCWAPSTTTLTQRPC